MSNADLGFWSGSISYQPSWSASPYAVNFGQTDYSFNGTAPGIGYFNLMAQYSSIGSWELNGNALDDSVPPNNGTPNAVTFGNSSTAIATQTSASFNGSSSYVSTSLNPSGYGSFTASVWVNMNGQTQSGSPRLISNSNGNHNGFELALTSGTNEPFFRMGNGATTYTVISSTTPLPTSGWTHLVGTYNGTTLALYVNGTLVLTTAGTGTLNPGPQGIYLGYNPAIGSTAYFNGLIQGAAFLPSALTAAQVSQLFTASATPPSTSMGIGGVDWMWMSIQGWDSPTVSGSVVQRASDHGGWPTDQYLAPRTMTLIVHASAPTQAARDQARAELQAAIPVNDLALLTYNEPIPKQAMVRRSGQIVETYADLTDVEFQCVLVAPDPRKYTTSPHAYNTTAPVPNTGIGIPFTLPPTPSPYKIGSVTTAASLTAAFTVSTAVPIGGGVVLTMACGNSTAQTVTAADSKGNVYTAQASAPNPGSPAETLFTFTAPVTVALTTSDTITVTTTNSQVMATVGIAVPNFAGFDTFDTVIGDTTLPNVADTAPSTAQSINFVFFLNNASQTSSAPSDGRGWTQLANISTGTLSLDTFFVNNVSTASYNCTGLYGSTTQWAAISVVVDVTATPSSTVLPPSSAAATAAVSSATPVTSWTMSNGVAITSHTPAFVKVITAAGTVTSVTDPAENVYTQLSSTPDGTAGSVCQMFYTPNYNGIALSASLTFTSSVSTQYQSTLYSLPSGMSVSKIFTGAGAGGTVPTVTYSGLSNSTGTEYTFIANLWGEADVASAPAGWTVVHNFASNYFSRDLALFTQSSASGTITAASTPTSSWGFVVIAIENAPIIESLPALAQGGSVTVTNGGNFETRPIVTITGPISAPTLTLDGQKTVSFSLLTLNAGDKLVVNTDSKTAMLNGSYRPSDISSWWWVLQPGAHTIQLGGTTAGGAQMQVTYNDAWI